jgi:hypothetical protein
MDALPQFLPSYLTRYLALLVTVVVMRFESLDLEGCHPRWLNGRLDWLIWLSEYYNATIVMRNDHASCRLN